MRLNIFRIAGDEKPALIKKLKAVGLTSVSDIVQSSWTGNMYFSSDGVENSVHWITELGDLLPDDDYTSRSFFGAMVMTKGRSTFAITFGKAHMYVRPFCDYDFGIEIAKRIANEEDITQSSSRRYQGRVRKDLVSYSPDSGLLIPPGSSVDFIQGRIISTLQTVFGTKGKFGTSCLLTPDITAAEIGDLLTGLESQLCDPPRFKLPRTLLLSDPDEIARFDAKLIAELKLPAGVATLTDDSFDLYGVDFIFGSEGNFTLRCGHYKSIETERLTIKDVKSYIIDRKIPDDRVLNIKVVRTFEDGRTITQGIKEVVDFVADDDQVVLSQGKWLRFNEDYLEQLDDAVRSIETEDTEEALATTTAKEPAFLSELEELGYYVADKNFALLQTGSRTQTEAWDLQKGDTVYAVKFGTPQKLNYVVDQASSVMTLLQNRANRKDLPAFKRYCVWLGYRAKKHPPTNLADSRSIILKQKVEAWARLTREVGFTPVIKLTWKQHPEHDAHNKDTGEDDPI